MRYFVNLNSGQTFCIAETDAEKMLVKPSYELLEIDFSKFEQMMKGDRNDGLGGNIVDDI